MNTVKRRKYPYIVARNKPTMWEYYLTIKPNKRVYIQGISKNKLVKMRKNKASLEYMEEVSVLENGHRSKPRLAKQFYKNVFGKNAIATKIR